MKKKNYKIIALLLLLIGSLVISIGFNIYLAFRDTDSNNITEPDTTIADNQDVNKNNKKQLICTKTEKSDEVETKTVFTMDIADNGAITEQQKTLIGTYSNDDKYNNYKNLESKDSVLTYDDAKKQIIKTYEKTKLLNENGEEISIWYVNHQQQLEKNGYQCNVVEE